eukprot:SAG31_NODE_17336_length_674_cov_1.631304_1_plen_97_part_00
MSKRRALDVRDGRQAFTEVGTTAIRFQSSSSFDCPPGRPFQAFPPFSVAEWVVFFCVVVVFLFVVVVFFCVVVVFFFVVILLNLIVIYIYINMYRT